jgi:hypothetical protein
LGAGISGLLLFVGGGETLLPVVAEVIKVAGPVHFDVLRLLLPVLPSEVKGGGLPVLVIDGGKALNINANACDQKW